MKEDTDTLIREIEIGTSGTIDYGIPNGSRPIYLINFDGGKRCGVYGEQIEVEQLLENDL